MYTCFEFHSYPINQVASHIILGSLTCPEPGCNSPLPRQTQSKVNSWIFEQRAIGNPGNAGSSNSETPSSDDEVCFVSIIPFFLFVLGQSFDEYELSPFEKFTKYFIQALKVLSQRTTRTNNPIMTDLLELLLRKHGKFNSEIGCFRCQETSFISCC